MTDQKQTKEIAMAETDPELLAENRELREEPHSCAWWNRWRL